MFSIRKWGFYLTIYRWFGIKVKLLFFRTNKAISLQRHFFRYEEWRILFGGGTLHYGTDQNKLFSLPYDAPETFNVMQKEWHRFTANKPTLVLEIQRGQPHEGDIERAI